MKLTHAALAATTVLALTGCGLTGGGSGEVGTESNGVTTLTIGTSVTPHGDIWRFIDENLAADAGLDLDAVLTTNELVTSDHCYFAATGITDGDLLRGVRFADGRVHTQSIVMRSWSGTVRTVDAEHDVKKWSKWLGDRDAR